MSSGLEEGKKKKYIYITPSWEEVNSNVWCIVAASESYPVKSSEDRIQALLMDGVRTVHLFLLDKTFKIAGRCFS